MSFNIQSLKQKAETRVFSEIRKSQDSKLTAAKLITENNQALYESGGTIPKTYDIFLSHKSEDAEIILGILVELQALKYTVYIDWIDDPRLDRNNINKKTSNTLRDRMDQSKSLLFVTTKHASDSKWMPWELGYMDGKKDTAAILPVFADENSSSEIYKGQEYLGIYPYCIKAKGDKTEKERLWICDSEDIYVRFDSWLKKTKPYKH